jgi:N-6 DNA Methylase
MPMMRWMRVTMPIARLIEGENFGKVYEDFLGKFAIAEGAKGGEYFIPTSIVRLIVEIIEPFTGKILGLPLRQRPDSRDRRVHRRVERTLPALCMDQVSR